MKYAVLLVVLILVPGTFAQPPKSKNPTTKKPAAASKPKPVPAPTPIPLSEKEQFDKASAYELAADRVAALEKFLTDFPQTENRPAAVDLLTTSRGLMAEEKLLAGDPVEAVKLFRLVIAEAPQPVPDELFNESIAKIPLTLYRRGQRELAFELAGVIESKVENNTAQLLEMANFYIGLENGGEAMRVAAKAAAKDPTSAPVYRTLALAHRINFELEESANAYAKALELDPASVPAKRGLAEMKRALGKSDEAVTLYRELLAKNEADIQSRNGLILSLFESGKRADAETELAAALEKTPNNFVLMAGAGYWYASRGIGAKAVELAEKALAREPRYIWSHIAMARGLMAEGKPVAAEQVLVKARAYGNFPTLEYELASARLSAGFYREVAEDLSKHFVLSQGGVKTSLGARVQREEKSLYDLVAYERKASIFASAPADTVENSETLRALLDLDQKLNAPSPNESDVAAAADAFVKGSDKMKLHRQLHAASVMLQKRVALPKILEILRAATGNTDTALEVPAAGAAVMASELYDSRAIAFRKNDFLLVPDVPRQTLSSILRGKIEELAGWTLYQQGSYPEAIVRLRRAITVMPDKSAWWRSSLWRLGAALAADGKDADALTSYIDSYKTDKPDFGKYAVVEALYRKVHGSTDGLAEKIGVERVALLQPNPDLTPAATPSATPAAEGGNTKVPTAVPETQIPVSVKSDTEVTGPSDKPAPTDKEKTTPAANTEPVRSAPPPVVDPKPQDAERETEKTKDPPAIETKTDEVKKDPPVVETKIEEQKKEPAEVKPDEIKKDAPGEKPPDAEQKKVDTKPDAVKKDPPVEIQPETETTKVEAKIDPPIEELPEPKRVLDTAPRNEKPTEKPSTEKEKPPAVKPLFEPIIITIPNRRPPAKNNESKSAEEKTKPVDSTGSPGAGRPRVIEGQAVKLEEPGEPCTVGLSQETVSLINGGGTVGIVVRVESPGDVRQLTAISSSPKDIDVGAGLDIGGMPDRRFFVIKSIGTSLGVYQVIFNTPCGKKELIVTVR